MNREKLIDLIKSRQSFLCVGLDPDLDKIPSHLLEREDPIFEFNKAIIDATRDYCVAYKPNLAFYECIGLSGWQSLQKTVEYIGDSHFTIADAKRGDIGNTSRKYAEAFFDHMAFDSITIAPYMGSDSVKPFLDFDQKWVILLALTSNPGADDFQLKSLEGGEEKLYERVIKTSSTWGHDGNMMYVVGATRPEYLREIRNLIPNHFLLVPGVGAQGGSLSDVAEYGMTADVGLLVNASRSVIYASSGEDFAEAAQAEARRISTEMKSILQKKSVI